MKLLSVNDNRYIIKAVFSTSRIKDMKLLKEIKGFWGATSIINDKRSRQTFLVEKINDAVILEEWDESDNLKEIENKYLDMRITELGNNVDTQA